MWHVSNEYACHNLPCYCDTCARRLPRLAAAPLRRLDALNDAWGTAFWSQRYTDWEQVLPAAADDDVRQPDAPCSTTRASSSDALLDFFRAEKAVLDAPLPRRPGHDELHDA